MWLATARPALTGGSLGAKNPEGARAQQGRYLHCIFQTPFALVGSIFSKILYSDTGLLLQAPALSSVATAHLHHTWAR
jgi:hypothetical protein